MTTVAEAESMILERMPRWPAEAVLIADAVNRVLAETVTAERDQPPFDRVTMDGIAIAFKDLADGIREFDITGTQAAGVTALSLTLPGQCIEIMTGAIRPDGADTIVPVERLRIESGRAAITSDADVVAGQFIHQCGSDRRHGAVVLTPGTRLGPAEIAVLASSGKGMVATTKLAQVGVISTGDELVGVDDPVEPHQIRSSNDLAVAASLEGAHLARVTRVRLNDDPERILAATRDLHAANDALILSGGVSMGHFDFVPSVLETLGCKLVFHRINQKPGRPMWFGVSGAGKPVFALPGNPVSTLLCMTRYVLPAFRYAAGLTPSAPETAVLGKDVVGPEHWTYFVPVKIRWSADGTEVAEPRPTNTSGDFATLADTDGFVELSPGQARRPAGTTGRIYRW